MQEWMTLGIFSLNDFEIFFWTEFKFIQKFVVFVDILAI